MTFIRKFVLQYLNTSAFQIGIQEQRLLWLVKLRFIALFSQLPLTLIGRYYGYLDQSSHLIFAMALILLIAYNSHLYRALTLNEKKSSELFITLQMTGDLLAFTALLSISGSSNNPFYAFFYVMAVLGGIFSSSKTSYIFGAVLVFCILTIQVQPFMTNTSAIHVAFTSSTFPYLLVQLLIPFVTFLIARSFGALLEKTQERLLVLAIQSERLDRLRALGSLSAGFSHEFASPLQNVKMRLNRIFSHKNFSEDDFTECQSSIEDCEKVLRNMNFSQLQVNNENFEKVHIGEITQDCIESWKKDNPSVSVHFESTYGFVRINKLNFAQALLNLLDNAFEASPSNPIINLRIECHSQWIILKVSDQGIGFSQEVIQRFGEPFNTNKTNGTGLGLYSVNLFMTSVGGNLKIVDNLSKGATVEMIFPRLEEA